MKFFQKTWVAWLCTAAMIGAAVVIGLNKESAAVPEPGEVGLDTSLSTAQFADYIWDQAGVLSDSQERDICLYNANWVQRYDSLIALAVVDGVSGDIGDYAYSLGEEIELASSDGILVIDVKNTNGYLAVGPDYPMTDQQVTNYMDQSLYEYVAAGEYGEGVLNLFADVNQFYVDNYGLGYLDNANHYGGCQRTGGLVMMLVILLAIALVAATLIDSARYTAYRQRYYGVVNPPYVFRPILFWHGPSYGWYRRRWRQPPPPPPPRDLEGPAVEASAAFRVGRRLQRERFFQWTERRRLLRWFPRRRLLLRLFPWSWLRWLPGAEDFLVAAVEALAEAEAAGSAVDRKIGACPWGWTRPFCRPLGNGLGHTWRLDFIYIRGTNDSGE